MLLILFKHYFYTAVPVHSQSAEAPQAGSPFSSCFSFRDTHFLVCTGSKASHHRDHQSQRCPAGDGNAQRFQHDHPRAQHRDRGAADGGFGGEKNLKADMEARSLLEAGGFAAALHWGAWSCLRDVVTEPF